MLKTLLAAGLLMVPSMATSVSLEVVPFESRTSAWQLPFESPHQLARAYLQPNSDYSAGHRGVDFAVSMGDKLLAPADGTITVAKFLVDRPVIAIRHGADMITEFEPACTSLTVGTAVTRGQDIGQTCNADSTYKQHCPDHRCLHFSLRVSGKYLSPLALIGGLNPSRLFPSNPHD